MAKYNIIKNSVLTSSTISGTGNKSLSVVELASLFDGNITTSSVSLTNTDVLYLEVDLGYRLQISDIFLYADDLTKLNNVNFYFKNNYTDVFTICQKQVSSSSYIGTISLPSAPRYIRCTISGV